MKTNHSVNVEVTKLGNENNLATLRKFTKKVQSSGILNRKRKIRYKDINESFYKKKVKTLERLRRKSEIEKLIKLGKMPDTKRKFGHK